MTVQEIIWVDATQDYGKPRLAVFFKPSIGGAAADYLMGQTPPRYPVPAIPTMVTWDYCWCMGHRTKMHVLFWHHAKNLGWYIVKAIQKEG